MVGDDVEGVCSVRTGMWEERGGDRVRQLHPAWCGGEADSGYGCERPAGRVLRARKSRANFGAGDTPQPTRRAASPTKATQARGKRESPSKAREAGAELFGTPVKVEPKQEDMAMDTDTPTRSTTAVDLPSAFKSAGFARVAAQPQQQRHPTRRNPPRSPQNHTAPPPAPLSTPQPSSAPLPTPPPPSHRDTRDAGRRALPLPTPRGGRQHVQCARLGRIRGERWR